MLIYLQEQGFLSRWRMIGAFLSLSYSSLKVIERNEVGEEERMMAMVNEWLISGRATKQALIDALQRLR